MRLHSLTAFATGLTALPLSAHELISPHSHADYGSAGLGALLLTAALIATCSVWRKYTTDKQ